MRLACRAFKLVGESLNGTASEGNPESDASMEVSSHLVVSRI